MASKDNEQVLSMLVKLTEQVKASTSGDDRARLDALTSCRNIMKTLETPGEAVLRMTWVEPTLYSIFRTATGLSLFSHLNADNGSPKSSAQLAEMCSADPILILRMMRNMVAGGAVNQVGPDSFAPGPLAVAMAQSAYKETFNYMHDFASATSLIVPQYLAKRDYRLPSDPLDTPVQYWFDSHALAKPEAETKPHFFEIMAILGNSHGLAAAMQVWHENRPHWSDDDLGFYPVKERLVKGANDDPDAVFIVDVGGSTGTDLLKFLERHPRDTFPGRVILQDLPEIIDGIQPGSISKVIELTVHDFFTPQPVKGARAYFLHSILHDHPDERAQLILQQLAKAMTPGYSKILIWEHVIVEENLVPVITALDWEMMTFFAAGERSESHWKALIEGAGTGLKMNGIWKFGQNDQCVIEAELA